MTAATKTALGVQVSVLRERKGRGRGRGKKDFDRWKENGTHSEKGSVDRQDEEREGLRGEYALKMQ